jgi:hypothetical protein
MKRILMITVAALPLFALPLLAAEADQRAKEASISFADMGGIQNWQADGEKAIYIQGRRNSEWYHATLMSPCIGLNFTDQIGFDIEPSGEFNKFGAIVVDGRKCPVTSLVKSAPPPKKKK